MQIIERQLSNGLPVVFVKMPGAKSVTGVYLVQAGWIYETKRIEGAAHFLEHMLFRGTRRWPTSMDLAYQIEGGGGEYNAFTHPETIKFYVSMPAREAFVVPNVLSDMILHPLLRVSDIEAEKGPVLEELAMYETDVRARAEVLFLKLMFGAHPYAWSGVGTKRSIARICRGMLVSYMRDMFTAQNSVLIFAGDIGNTDKFSEWVTECWDSNILHRAPRRQAHPFMEDQAEPRIVISPRSGMEQALVKIGVKFACPDRLAQRAAILVLSTIIGGGSSSRLFLEVREKRGLAYGIGSSVFFQHGCSYLEIETGLNKRHWKEGVSAIMFELNRILNEGVSGEELERAKRFLMGAAEVEYERSKIVALSTADDWMERRRVITLEDKLRLVEGVDVRDVKEAVDRIFRNDRLNCAVLGPGASNERAFRPIVKFV